MANRRRDPYPIPSLPRFEIRYTDGVVSIRCSRRFARGFCAFAFFLAIIAGLNYHPQNAGAQAGGGSAGWVTTTPNGSTSQSVNFSPGTPSTWTPAISYTWNTGSADTPQPSESYWLVQASMEVAGNAPTGSITPGPTTNGGSPPVYTCSENVIVQSASPPSETFTYSTASGAPGHCYATLTITPVPISVVISGSTSGGGSTTGGTTTGGTTTGGTTTGGTTTGGTTTGGTTTGGTTTGGTTTGGSTTGGTTTGTSTTGGETSGGSTTGGGSTGGDTGGNGVVSINGQNQALAGTAITFEESGITNPVWSFDSANVIKNYILPSNAASQIVNLQPSDLDQQSVTFYDTDQELLTVTCQGTYTAPTGTLSVIATEPIQFWLPTITWEPESGYVQEDVQGSYPTGSDGWMVGPNIYYGLQWGMNYFPLPNTLYADQSYDLEPPTGFEQSGTAQILQCMAPNRSLNADLTSISYSGTQWTQLMQDQYNNEYGLDVWPQVALGDSPWEDFPMAYELNVNATSSSIDEIISDSYTTWMMYMPPATSAGPSIWVPVVNFAWPFDCNATYLGNPSGGSWQSNASLPSDSVYPIVSSSYLPTWTIEHYGQEFTCKTLY